MDVRHSGPAIPGRPLRSAARPLGQPPGSPFRILLLAALALLLIGAPPAFAQAPPAPTGLTAQPRDSSAILSWTASTGATYYNVKRSLATGGSYLLVTSVTGTTFTDNGLTNGTAYYYVVSASNTSGESANSTEVNTTPNPPPDPPAGLAVTPGTGTAALTWSAAARATSYKVKRASSPTGPFSTIASPTTTSFTDSGLTQDAVYYYVVTGTSASGESYSSNEGVAPIQYGYSTGTCGAAPPQNYAYVVSDQAQLQPVGNLRVSSVTLPGVIQLSWTNPNSLCHTHFAWTRSAHPPTVEASGVTHNLYGTCQQE